MSPFERLTQELSKLPGIGGKTALRLSLHILRQPASYAQGLSQALVDAATRMRFCSRCFFLTEADPCLLCADERRDRRMICVVEDSSDLLALERSRGYRGLYHVLQGALSPLDGIGPENLRITELLSRVKEAVPSEIILATNHDVSGEATALYISKLLKPLGIKLTKLASGIPAGSDVEYLDSATLSRALQSRVEY
ncbi:MAG: recombination mediator RecR [Deltaproteobacteria bacterium]|nr:recombination mediator RecR [Deltaproteobacteria bacterium]